MTKQPTIEDVFIWLKEHDLITINRLEKKVGIPQRSLSKAMAGIRDLPEKYHADLIAELKKYGYK